MIGKTISHYKIIEKLGGGGMGVVYKAQDTKLDRTVALKFLPPSFSSDDEAKQRFIHEAKAASSLEHNNICNIHEIDETDDGQIFIAMSCYEGETLKKKIERGPLKIEEAIDVAIQTAKGLLKAHEKVIIHRDIKPSNIFITEEGIVKILDFGLAKVSSQTQLTRMGTTVGTVAYISPEQSRGEEVDNRTDIWSLGVVLYEMISGQQPFKGDYEQAVTYSIINEEPEPLTGLRTGVPMDLERIVNKTLSKNSEERYQHIDDFIADLNKLKKEISARTAKAIHLSTVIKKPHWKKFIPILIVAVLMIVIIFWLQKLFIQNDESPELVHKEKSIAVLPFTTITRVEKDEIFSAGIHDDILTQLAKIKDLKVISRTSVVRYKDTQKSIREIADELNVANILEGSVRLSGNRIRIIAQLVKADTDEHLWAETYDRDYADIFAIQSDVAQKIAAALKATLTSEEKVHIEEKPTDNMEAYDYFLKGKHFWNTKSTQEGNQKAVDMFDKATKLDPDFTLAYAWASIVHSILYGHRPWDHTQERKELAKGELDKALALDPDHPKVHFAKGIYQDWCLEDYNFALREYEIALKGEPNNGEIVQYLGGLYKRFGNWKKAEETLLKSYELNPFDLNSALQVGHFYRHQRQFNKAEHYYNLAIQSDPEHEHYYRGKAYNYLYGFGDINKARSLLKEAETIIPNTEGLSRAQFSTEILARDFPKALRYAKEEEKINSRTLFVGRTYYYQGKERLAQEEFESLRIYYENKVLEEGPDKARFQSNLGLIYAYLGLKDKAIEEGKKGTDLLPVSKDHIIGVYLVGDLAIIYILTGKHELALDKLEYLLSIPGYLTRWTLRLDPAYDPLRDNPRFQKLIEVGI